ncbi:MAG: helix-turn-helix domain-containing protein [Ruminococcaceae bacterium]|nr:helix-turn-helix domain-containing protein [Oscillospiraceae bacterium]
MKRFSLAENVARIGVSSSKKTIDGEYRTHWHEFYEIEYVLGGSGDYCIDGEICEMREGMLFLMTPLSFHSVNANSCTVYNLMFSERLCRTEYLVRFLLETQSPVLFLEGEERTLIEALLEEITKEQTDETYLSDLLNVLLGKILRKKSTSAERICSLDRGLVYLLAHFREAPSLAEVAAYSGFTPTYFSSLFKKETGTGFREYLDRLRFEHAKKLLTQTEMSVAAVCRESGFSDYPNFIRRFKERFGVSPGELRKR